MISTRDLLPNRDSVTDICISKFVDPGSAGSLRNCLCPFEFLFTNNTKKSPQGRLYAVAEQGFPSVSFGPASPGSLRNWFRLSNPSYTITKYRPTRGRYICCRTGIRTPITTSKGWRPTIRRFGNDGNRAYFILFCF